MRRRFLLLFSAAAVAAVTFVAVSLAAGATPSFSTDQPAEMLPATPLADDLQLEIGNVLGDDLTSQYGITPASYEEARTLAQTTAGPLYVIPGLGSVCVVLLPAIACGSSSEPVAVYVTNPSGDLMVGGGVAPSTPAEVILTGDEGEAIRAQLVDGGFVVTEEQSLERGQVTELTVK